MATRKRTVQQALATREHHDRVTETREYDNDRPQLPALRTFKVTVERWNKDGSRREDVHMIHAHQYGHDGDLAKFHVMEAIQCENPECDEWHIVTTTPRSIRPVLDVEEVFEQTQTVN